MALPSVVTGVSSLCRRVARGRPIVHAVPQLPTEGLLLRVWPVPGRPGRVAHHGAAAQRLHARSQRPVAATRRQGQQLPIVHGRRCVSGADSAVLLLQCRSQVGFCLCVMSVCARTDIATARGFWSIQNRHDAIDQCYCTSLPLVLCQCGYNRLCEASGGRRGRKPPILLFHGNTTKNPSEENVVYCID